MKKESKYKRYYMVADGKHCIYLILSSDLPFRINEGVEQLKESYPKAKKINHIVKSKAEGFLGMFFK